MPISSTESTPADRSQSASPTPPGPCPSKPEYAAACSPLSKTASIRDRSSAGCSSSPPLPTTQCGGQLVTKSGSAEKCEPGSMWWSRVATTCSYAPDASRSVIAAATSAPPATASEPPSVKSSCTSTTTAANVISI